MKKIIPVLLIFITGPLLSSAQTTDKIETFVLTRMVDKLHVDPSPVNAVFSANVFAGMSGITDL